MNDRNDLDHGGRLRRAVDDLPRDLLPPRDLWPGIAARLEERRAAPAGAWWRLAAAVAMTAAGLVVAVLLRPDSPAAGPRLTVAASTADSAMAAPYLRQRDGVVHAHNDLVAVVSRRRGYLDEAGAAALSAALADLERATSEIEAALNDNPGDRRLRLALAAAYRREAGWTSRLNRI